MNELSLRLWLCIVISESLSSRGTCMNYRYGYGYALLYLKAQVQEVHE